MIDLVRDFNRPRLSLLAFLSNHGSPTERSPLRISNGVDFSVVIPAYNEEKRLPATLERLLPLLENVGRTYEIVIVDDGSRDTTDACIVEIAKKHPSIIMIGHFPNRGRGFSVREGIFRARGEIVLEMDADGSVDSEAVGRFYEYLRIHSEVDAVFGSRDLPGSAVAVHQPFIRWFLGYCFLWLARVLFRATEVTDFTLGFKMFRRRAAEDIFSHQFENQYVAEAEIVYVAKKRGWRVKELPVSWRDNRDSRVRPIRDSLHSFAGMLRIVFRDFLGYH